MLKHDLRFSLLLALGAALTMGLKVRAIGYDRATDSPAFTRALQASLEDQGFTTRYEPHQYQSDVIEATRGTCRMRVRDATWAGQYTGLFQQQSGGLGPIRYVYHGDWLATPPLLRMNLERSGAHMLVGFGLSGRFQPALAVAARGCNQATADFSAVYQSWVRG